MVVAILALVGTIAGGIFKAKSDENARQMQGDAITANNRTLAANALAQKIGFIQADEASSDKTFRYLTIAAAGILIVLFLVSKKK